MNRKLVFILIGTIISSSLYGQETRPVIKGKVSFVTSKNIYVKFDDTKPINIGDTLYVSKTNSACLLVTHKSSSSCVGSIINECIIEKGDEILFKFFVSKKPEIAVDRQKTTLIDENESIIEKGEDKKEVSLYEERIKSRLSVSSYSNMSDIRDDRHRVMTRFSLNADHINNSKFSVDTYLNYSKNFIPDDNNGSIKTSFFNIYNLAVKYDVDTTLSITLGRKINYKISSLGAIDGLQAEKHFKNNYVGVIAGFRPDFIEYDLNTNLLQYGGYIGRVTNSENFRSQTTLGFIQQTNQGEIDRRYTYFQHSSTIFKKLNLFSSMELDLYNKFSDENNKNVRLTNFYTSARYRFNRKINLSLSYDSRKRIIYYETFQTQIEQLLDQDIARQGIRARINVRPIKYLSTAISYGKRFQSDSQNKSDNINGYISWSRIPRIGGRVSLNYNMNTSNYLKSNIISLRHSRDFFNTKLNADFYYRFVNYDYITNDLNLNQHYFGTYLSFYLNRTLMISLSGELAISDIENNYRINTKIVKRFYRNKKN